MMARVFLAFLLACTAGAKAQEPVRIGVLTDFSGNFAAVSGRGALVATLMAVEDFGGTVLGRPIEVLQADHKNKPDLALSFARGWYDNGVDAIVDIVNSAAALGVQDLARQKNRIAIVSGAGSVDLTGPRCSPTTFHWTWDTYADANVPVAALAKDGGLKWFFLTADFAFGTAMERDATAALTAVGGTVLGTAHHPLGETDFAAYLLKAQSSGADVVALANGGADTINSLKQAAEFGLTRKQKVAALAMNIPDIKAIGLEKAQGALVVEAFYWDRDEATRAWSKRFFDRVGAMPAQGQAGDYSAVMHYLKAVKAAGTTDASAVADKMRALAVDDMFTHGGIVRGDGRMIHDMYLMRVKSPSESKYPWDYYTIAETVPGARAFRSREAGGCPLPG